MPDNPFDPVLDLLNFIDRSPTPYHAVAQTVARLSAAGYRPLDDASAWSVEPGDRRYLVRGDGSLVACEIGTEPPATAGFHVIGAHTDSPNLRLKPSPDKSEHGYGQLAVEPYGGLLLHTWLDRDLSLAGRVVLAAAGGTRSVLLDFERPLLRVPNLAIHLQREIHEDGLKLNPQQHAVPLVGLGDVAPIKELIVAELRARDLADAVPADVLGHELMAYDVQPAAVGGARGEFIHAARLDNLGSCHAGLCALLDAGERGAAPFTRMLVLYDHEEVGSRSAQGAAGPLLESALERIATGYKGGEPQALARALGRSLLVSADMAHAVHPNFADRHEPGHRPVIGGGPVIKVNANQAYATDAATSAVFARLCQKLAVDVQHFVARSDMGCGSTIGPISAARVGIPTVDVGNPMLSMHSVREMAGSADVAPMIAVLCEFLCDADAHAPSAH